MKAHFILFLVKVWLLVACNQDTVHSIDKKQDLLPPKVVVQVDGYELDRLATHATSGCELGIALAKADEKKGITGYYFWGITISPLSAVLSDKYGVQVFARGCNVTEGQVEARRCYNDYMRQLLQFKYKQDVIALETDTLREKHQERIKQVWLEIENNKKRSTTSANTTQADN
jgi:hypothetical protein